MWKCGSASIANHFLCDFNKGIRKHQVKNLSKVISLSSNVELITALANDISYEKEDQMKIMQLVLITLSCSGTSKNIINVMKFAKKKVCMSFL